MVAGAARLVILRPAVLLLGAGCLVALWLLPPFYVAGAVLLAAGAGLVLRYPLVGLVLLAFSVPWGSGYEVSLGAFPVTTTDVIIAVVGTAWLVSSVHYRHNPISTRVWTPYLALFLAALALSTLTAIDLHASEKEIVKWIELGVIYFSGSTFLRSERHVRVLVAALVAAGASQALFGFVQTTYQLGPQAFLHGGFLRAYGSFDQPNPYAGYLNMVLPFALTMGVEAPSSRERSFYRFALVLLFGGLLASESRGALLATMAAVCVVLGCLYQRTRVLIWLGILAGVSGAWLAQFGLVPLSPFARFMDAIGLGGVAFGHVTDANFSAVERSAHWLAGVRMFAAHPILGVGIGNYSNAYPAYHPRGWYASLAHAHNYYINIAAEAGIAGLVTYILFTGSALWYSFVTMRRAESHVYHAALLGVLGALVATSIHNLFDVLYVHGMVALLGLLMALIPASLPRSDGLSPFRSIERAAWTR